MVEGSALAGIILSTVYQQMVHVLDGRVTTLRSPASIWRFCDSECLFLEFGVGLNLHV